MKHKALGKGLSSLIPKGPPAARPDPAVLPTKPTPAGPYRLIDLDRIRPNPEQPRRDFEPHALDRHSPVDRFAHVINCQSRGRGGYQRFHLCPSTINR